MVGVGCLDLGSLRWVRWCLISCGFGVLVVCVSACVGFAGVVIWCFGIECGEFDFGGWGWFVGLWFGLGWLGVTVLGGGSGLGDFVLWVDVASWWWGWLFVGWFVLGFFNSVVYVWWYFR